MSTPQFQPPLPQMQKKRAVWPLVVIGCLGVGFFGVVILAAILFPVFAAAREKARAKICLSNERQMSLGLMQYAQDFDEKLPRAAAWMDKISPYVASEKVLHCPNVRVENPQNYGYALDSRAAGKPMATLTKNTVTLYDSTSLGRSATDAGTSLPTPGRHASGRGNDIAYADGHVRYVPNAAP